MKHFVVIALLCITGSMCAQRSRIHFGITAATGLSWLNSGQENFGSERKGSVAAGINVYFDMSSRWHLVSGLNWEAVSLTGIDYSPLFGCDINVNGEVDLFNSYSGYRDKVQYLVLPVELRYMLSENDQQAFYLQAGITNHFKISNSGNSFFAECGNSHNTGDSFNSYSGMHVRGSLGCGYRIKLGKLRVFLLPVIQYSLNPVIDLPANPHLLNLALRAGVEF